MSLCTARACSNPTQTMLCQDCLDGLVKDLRELGHGGTAKVRVHRVPTPGMKPDEQPTREIVDRRQGLLADLQDTVTRTDHIGPSGAGKVRGADVSSLEVNLAASRLADEARNTIGTWARDVWEVNRHLHLPSTHAEACEWLAGLERVLAVHPAAGELHDDIVSLAGRIRRMVDIKPDLTYLGICSGVLRDHEVCDWDLYAESDADWVKCPRCRELHDVSYRQTVMLKAMEAQLLPATELRTVLTRYMPQGVPSVNTIRSWAARGKLTKKPALPGSTQPRYRVGDVLDLIAKQEQDDQDKEGKAS